MLQRTIIPDRQTDRQTDRISLSFFASQRKKMLSERARCVCGFSVGVTRPFALF